ncbi:helix-turn-helix transcriptional regulator [Enterobacter kobei]|nr:helix-turn-helix transcriptional regulator [Enterobacter kobei]
MSHTSKTNKNIINNTNYLFKKSEESKLSFSERSGVTRSTIYKILNGEIQNIQRSTVEKIANFFGVSVKLLEDFDIASIDYAGEISQGNNNPISVPVIQESETSESFKKTISQLIANHRTTYCYTEEKNIICIQLSEDKKPFYSKGELIFIKRHFKGTENEPLAILKDGKVTITEEIKPDDVLIGYVIEERMIEQI